MFTITQVASSTPYDDSVTVLGADNVQDAIGILAASGGGVSSEYVAAAASNLVPFYLYSDASDVATYLVMKEGVPPGGGFGIQALAAVTGDLIAAFVSEPGVPGITAIPSGVYKVRAQARQSAGTKTSQIYFEIYKRVLAGTETLLGTSSDSSVLTGSNAEQIVDVVFASPITFLSTDRIVVKLLVRVSGAGTAPDVNVDIQGTTLSRFEWPASILAAANTYADSVAALQWHLSGNAGTPGTSVVGTTDAQPWTTIANGIYIDSYAIDGQVSSIMNVVALDATQFIQKRNQVNLSAAADVTGANFYGHHQSVNFAGTFSHDGNIVANYANVDISTTGTVNFSSAFSCDLNFSGGATINQVKGVNMNAGANGATFGYYAGIGSYLNANAGTTGGGRLIETGLGVDDSTTSGWELFGGNMNVTGTTVNTNNLSVLASSIGVRDTAHTDGISALNITAELRDDSTCNGMTGFNLNVNTQENAVLSGGILSFNNTVSALGTSTNTGVTGNQVNIQLRDTSDSGHVAGDNIGISFYDDATASSCQAIGTNIFVQDNSVVDNLGLLSVFGQLQDSAHVDNFNGLYVNPKMAGSSTVINFSPFTVNADIQDTPTITNGVTLANFFMQSSVQLSQLTGLGLNIDSVSVADPAQKNLIQASGGITSYTYNMTVPPAATFLAYNQWNTGIAVANGSPISSLGFINNFGFSIELHDDWTPDFTGIRLGLTPIACVGQGNIDAGKTLDSYSGVLSGLNMVGGSGTIDQAFCFRAAGIIPGGGTPTVNLEVGFYAMPTIGFLSGGNSWAFRDDTSGSENYLGKLAIGSATKKVSNSDVALEIGNSKAFLNGSGTTAQRTALTPISGMQFYDTDLAGLYWYNGTSWVLAGAASYTDEQEQPAGATDNVNVTFTLSNTPVAPKAVILAINGAIKHYGIDFTVAGTTLTTTVPPTATQNLWVIYRY